MDLFTVGKIINTHGIHGEVKVSVETDFPEQRFVVNNKLYLAKEDRLNPIEVEINSVRKHKGFFLLSFKNLLDINLVEKYKNYYLYITQDEQHELSDGQYYYRQIIGLKVIDENEHYLGTIKEIMSPGANDVWIVEKPNKAELLLPVIDDVIKSVDLDKQEVHIEMMDGLDDED